MSLLRILLIEDEEQIRNLVKLNLELENYEVVATPYGKKALDLVKEQHFHLIILDLMLPDITGIDVCERIRLENTNIPIIIVSAKDTSIDRITGLKMGADDYLTKPFHLEELLLRVNKLIQRSTPEEEIQKDIYVFGSNKVDIKTFQADTVNGVFILSKKEIMLLKLLIDRKNEVVSRQQILQSVWGFDVFPSTRTIDNFILAFRKYFEINPKKPKLFLSVRGVGYKFSDESL